MSKNFPEIRPFNRRIESNKIEIFSSCAYMPRFHYHLEYELFYIDKGSGIFGIDDAVYDVSEGDVFFIEPDIKHYFKSSGEKYHYYAFIFDLSAFGSEDDDSRRFLKEIKISTQLKLTQELLTEFKKAVVMEKEERFGQEILIKSLLFRIFAYIIESKQFIVYSNREYVYHPQTYAVQKTCSYIRENYQEKIDYKEIIKLSNYSKSQFIKIFKKETGMNITDYINRYRVERACLDMIKTSKSITEIATENGFNNVQYFSKIFKEIMACTPREYKVQAMDILLPTDK